MFANYRSVFVLMLLLISSSFAIIVVSPPVGEIENGAVLDLGTIGPGQTVSILIDPTVKTGGLHSEGGRYDLATVGSLPPGWTTRESKLYADPLQVTVSADPLAKEGQYNFTVNIIDENNGEELGRQTIKARVRVTYDVMDFQVSPTKALIGPGQPARFAIDITNKASTGDVFEISTQGPRRWTFKKQIYVPAKSTKTLNYEIVGNEEETFQTTVKVTSLASNIIHDEKNITMEIRSNLIGDWKATNQGTLIFPIFESAIYGFAGLISNFF
ncbi:hypothetical protein HY990_00945 [Candidatus Micrarchaeota archaeon]|nr:hypothetical protein [Candidatus Micrarchaeota archaeon]